MYGAYQNVWAQHPQDHPIWRDINHVRFPAALLTLLRGIVVANARANIKKIMAEMAT